jgi:hypothetical protein
MSNLQRSPLKPDQKLRLLKNHLIPRLLYGLQTPHIERKTLKEADKVIRRFVWEALHLHYHTQDSFIHARHIYEVELAPATFLPSVGNLKISRDQDQPTGQVRSGQTITGIEPGLDLTIYV